MISFDFLFPPILGCGLIVLINVYFGIHVIKREIIFIDIALAQISALGGVIGGIILNSAGSGHEHDENTLLSYIVSLIFISLAAIVFTLLKHKKIPIPLEAIIGISFAVATTLAVIILDKASGGDVHVHDMLIGSVLWVSWNQIIRLLIAVSAVGLFHFLFRKKFITLTNSFKNEKCTLKNSRMWDFLFYFSFGIVVIEAVNVAGILTVFAFLIIPASLTVFISKSWIMKLIAGWTMGIIAAVAGVLLSVKLDVPSPPVIIILLGFLLLLGYGFIKIKAYKDI